MSEQEIVEVPCASCHRNTKHSILHTRTVERNESDTDGNVFLSYSERYDTLQCRGCESLSLRCATFADDDRDPVDTTYYPPPADRALPSWSYQLPDDVRGLLKEVYGALHADSRRLALMGARTAIDIVLLEKVGDVGTFENRLKKLEEAGFVAPQQREILDAALEAGHAGIHRGFRPTRDHLMSVIDIVESLLQAVYILVGQAAELRKAIPPRSKKR